MGREKRFKLKKSKNTPLLKNLNKIKKGYLGRDNDGSNFDEQRKSNWNNNSPGNQDNVLLQRQPAVGRLFSEILVVMCFLTKRRPLDLLHQ
jgi:hypothetical protein